eukprot:TRINITY_DN3863_c0_g1_i4.p1 TRINITY_DN3863_c0_g1~~TRINITY_DN3863_c0_g1_i4.p1  ORF type:complete len:344 (+),score=101.49 TRINITY_DN3863_c0_g1_i4:290-1321(+)
MQLLQQTIQATDRAKRWKIDFAGTPHSHNAQQLSRTGKRTDMPGVREWKEAGWSSESIRDSASNRRRTRSKQGLDREMRTTLKSTSTSPRPPSPLPPSPLPPLNQRKETETTNSKTDSQKDNEEHEEKEEESKDEQEIELELDDPQEQLEEEPQKNNLEEEQKHQQEEEKHQQEDDNDEKDEHEEEKHQQEEEKHQQEEEKDEQEEEKDEEKEGQELISQKEREDVSTDQNEGKYTHYLGNSNLRIFEEEDSDSEPDKPTPSPYSPPVPSLLTSLKEDTPQRPIEPQKPPPPAPKEQIRKRPLPKKLNFENLSMDFGILQPRSQVVGNATNNKFLFDDPYLSF